MVKQDLFNLFKEDAEFISNYNSFHTEVESSLPSIVNDTWKKIKNLRKVKTHYGYFAVDSTYAIPSIVGFYVLPEYRGCNSLMKDMITETDYMFLCTVSNTNKRAYNFLNRFCKIMETDSIKTVFYYVRGS